MFILLDFFYFLSVIIKMSFVFQNGDEAENKVNTNNSGTVGRLVTLQNLLGAGILQPGPGAMTIDYLVRLQILYSGIKNYIFSL